MKRPSPTQLAILDQMADGAQLTAPGSQFRQGLAAINRRRVSVSTLCAMKEAGWVSRVLRTQYYDWGNSQYWEWILTSSGREALIQQSGREPEEGI